MTIDWEDERFDGMMRADGLDEAILGVVNIPMGQDVLAYDMQKVIQILMDRDGMSQDDALEFYYFNIEGAFVGEGTPLWVHSMDMFQ